ncbi:hypothetical protein CTAYLR_005379 [Chrysophaeum taylorii]|uniref:Protein kinase domain-containing protein n=1 Tax=Chrysophaeum taylorii TaxID=2483200 RepID=A0AAD7UA08_9STRA|nr:hypothetical protein CTAYLR_005379 [Chrysophaeum taylorii]
MAPELLKKDEFTEKSDVYSYGMVLYEITTRAHPWAGLKAAQIVCSVVVDEMRPAVSKYADAHLVTIMRHCWAQGPNERPSFEDIIARYFHVLPPPTASDASDVCSKLLSSYESSLLNDGSTSEV